MKPKELIHHLKKFTTLMEENSPTLRKLQSSKQPNQWLYGADVKKILNISESTLKRMRLRNDIPYIKISRTYYYPSIFFTKVLLLKIKRRFTHIFEDQ